MIRRLVAGIIARRACSMTEADIERIRVVVREEIGPRFDAELAARLTAMGAVPFMPHLLGHSPNPARCRCPQSPLGHHVHIPLTGGHT